MCDTMWLHSGCAPLSPRPAVPAVMTPEPAASLKRQIGMRASVVLLALAVAGCASGSHASGSHASGTASAAAPRYSPAQVSVQVQVPSRTMEAGSSMLAHIIVDNRTGHAIHAKGCGQLFELALGNSSHPALSGLARLPADSHHPDRQDQLSMDDQSGLRLLRWCRRRRACLLAAPGSRPRSLLGNMTVVFSQQTPIVSVPPPIPVRVTPRPLHPAAVRSARKEPRVCRTSSGADVSRIKWS